MRFTILSRAPTIPSTRRLIEAAKARGHGVRVFNPLEVEMHLDGKAANLYHRQKKIPRCDVVIPRIAQSISAYGLAVVNQFAMQGVPQLNSAQGIAQARNKMRSLQLLSANGIDIPATVMARSAADLKAMVGLVGGVPVLVKLLQGQEKRGVMVCESLQSLEATLEAILGLGQNLILQQYVKKAGQDVRVVVIGGKAVAAVRRIPRVGRMTQTLQRGARLERCEISPAQRRAAEKAAILVGLEVAAVDLLDVKEGPKVFEVNSSPALPEMEEACQLDLAALVIGRAEELASGAPALVGAIPEPPRVQPKRRRPSAKRAASS